MFERLREFYDLKRNPLKTILFFVILLVLNSLMYYNIFNSASSQYTGQSSINVLDVGYIIIGLLELIFVILLFVVKRDRNDSKFIYTLKTKLKALGYVGIIGFVFLPLIFGFYSLVKNTINYLKDLPDTIIIILAYISGVLIIVGLWILINYVLTSGISEEEDSVKKVEEEKTNLDTIFKENKIEKYDSANKKLRQTETGKKRIKK